MYWEEIEYNLQKSCHEQSEELKKRVLTELISDKKINHLGKGAFETNISQIAHIFQLVSNNIRNNVPPDRKKLNQKLQNNLIAFHSACLQTAWENRDDKAFKLFNFDPVPDTFQCDLTPQGDLTSAVQNEMTVTNDTESELNTEARINYVLEQSCTTAFTAGISVGVSYAFEAGVDIGIANASTSIVANLNLNFEVSASNTTTKRNELTLIQPLSIPIGENRLVVVTITPLESKGTYSCYFIPNFTRDARTDGRIRNQSVLEVLTTNLKVKEINEWKSLFYVEQKGELTIKGGFNANVHVSNPSTPETIYMRGSR